MRSHSLRMMTLCTAYLCRETLQAGLDVRLFAGRRLRQLALNGHLNSTKPHLLPGTLLCQWF